MPLVHISLLKGKSPDYLRAISRGVHRALVETYSVPAADCFQLFHQHEPQEFVYDADYLGIHRTDDVVFIHITAGNWRDTPTKQALYKRIAELLAEDPGLRPEDAQVIISPNDRDDWSFGKGLASYIKEPSA
jgi:phenylpyruvate tautomerase PptA (4-oxalocrotonate tautomerase family)